MRVIECLYSDLEDFKCLTQGVVFNERTLIQIYTATLQKEEAHNLACEINNLYPEAKIIGCSVGTVLHEGIQYDDKTMIVVEAFDTTELSVGLFSTEGLSPSQVAEKICQNGNVVASKMTRVFFGDCYKDAHQFLDEFNARTSGVKLVGGMAGDGGSKNIHPYVFNQNNAFELGCVFVSLCSETLNAFSGVNISHQEISEACTITKCEGSNLIEIDGKPAADWFQSKLGYLSTDVYTTWEEIATCDPLMRFQIQLEGRNGASRFIKYDHTTNTFSQYFTRVNQGDQFKLSYTSPAKCVDETRGICDILEQEPVEHLFTYSCLLRKMFLQNCSNWEISPFKQSKLSGVFLLGEFGAIENKYNQFLNGSCVYCGVAEEESYVDVDFDAFDNLKKIQAQEKDLLDFIKRKRSSSKSQSESDVFNHVIMKEHERQDYKYKDENFNMNNILKYEVEKEIIGIDKICLLKIENAADIIAHYGQDQYFDQLKHILFTLKEMNVINSIKEEHIHDYTISFDTFLMAATKKIPFEQFFTKMKKVDEIITNHQNQKSGVPMISRFVLAKDSDGLLEDAYGELEKNRNSQYRFMVADKIDKADNDLLQEFEILKDINISLVDNKVVPYYQGIRNNVTGKIDKYEALIRIISRDGTVLTPYMFLDIAKKHRLYLKLTRRMIECVLKDFNDVDYGVTINVSYLDISSKSFISFIKEQLKGFNNPSRIVFEILEDECFKEVDCLNEFIEEMRCIGAKVAIDDFGAGYSNLLEIIRIKPDYIKVDGGIIKEIHNNNENKLVLELITSLASNLNVELVAEFVENEEIQREVINHGIAYTQGYAYSKPTPYEELEFNK